MMRKPQDTALDAWLECHRSALASCRRCAHNEHVRPIASIARAPRAMLVGQAPGKVESEGGRPFAGRAGATLFRWLAQAGIDEAMARERIYISAMTRCYPGPSPSGRGDRVPSPAERALCASWLDDELRMIRPRLLIPVGRLAIDRFLEPLPLHLLIGREHAAALPGGGETRVIPLPHPSGASSWIHEPGHRELVAQALERIGRALRELGIVRAGTAETTTPAPPSIRSVA